MSAPLIAPVTQVRAQGHGISRAPGPARAPYALSRLQGFLLLCFACQLGLLFGPAGVWRVLMRAVPFCGSLALIALVPNRGPRHPATGWALASLAIVALGFLHPETQMLAGLAQFAMYAAVLGPLFWGPRLGVTPAVLHRVLLILWGFHAVSASLGVLQVLFPGRFQPNVSAVVLEQAQATVDGLRIQLANGERVWRPMGLTDVPGGAATAGLYASLFGAGFLLSGGTPRTRILAAGSMAVGLFCIYLSQVRSVLVMAGVGFFVLLFALVRRGEVGRFVGLAAAGACVIVTSTLWALSVGGETVSQRLRTLIADDPGQVYYTNRGLFLEDTILNQLPRYPLGAGLARWEMMNRYFGDPNDPQSPPLWAEIQWTGWLFDGGVPLVLCYSAALLVTLLTVWRISVRTGRGPLALWAAVVFAYDVSVLAMTFNYPIFIGQGGMEFWLLNALLLAATAAPRHLPEPRPA